MCIKSYNGIRTICSERIHILPNNLTDQAYAKILSRIIDLDYVPGQKISEKNIESDIGIGRTPVREAILRLKQGGLITVIPQSGTYVSLIELNRVNDAIFSRRNLESSILQEAAQQDFSEIEKNRLDHLYEELINAAQEHNISAFFKYFDQIHRSYYVNSNHKMIWNWMENINIYFYRIIVLNLKADQVSWQQIIEYEKQIMKAITNKDSKKVAEMLSKEMTINEDREHGLINAYPDYFDLKEVNE